MAMEVVYNKAPYGRRMFANLFDLACLFVVGSLLAWLYSAILPFFPFYQSAQNSSERLQEESSLYIRSNGQWTKIDKAYAYEDKSRANDIYEEALLKFYVCPSFFPKNDGLSRYASQKIGENPILDERGEPYWEKNSSGDIVKKESVSDEKMNAFYITALNDYAYSYMNLNDEYLASSRTIAYSWFYGLPLILNLDLLIFGLMIPLCLKRGKKTLGKLIFGLAVVDVHALSPQWWHYLLRFLFLLLIEIDLSIVTFGIPLIVSFTMMVFSKRGQSFHDYVANTYVVDVKNQKVYLSEEEFVLAQNDLENLIVQNIDLE